MTRPGGLDPGVGSERTSESDHRRDVKGLYLEGLPRPSDGKSNETSVTRTTGVRDLSRRINP